MSLKTWFKGEWTAFLNWFGAAEASVIAEGKTIIDELVPVVQQDLLADGSTMVTAATAALATGADPITGIAAAAKALIPIAEQQGITLSTQAATVAASFIAAKISAAQAAGAGPSAPTTQSSGATS